MFTGLLIIAQPATSAPVLYSGGANGTTSSSLVGSLLILDQSTAAATQIGTTGNPSSIGITGLAFDSLGNLYASTIRGGVTLEKIDPYTGLQLSSITLSAALSDLSFQPLTDVLFGMSSSSSLYTVNVTTGAATLVGDTGAAKGGLGFGPDGTLYLASFDGFLHTLDPTTGAVLTSVALTQVYDGLGVRPSDGAIFADTAGPLGDFVYRIDPVTGAETFVGETLIGTTGVHISDVAFQAVPEPGSWSLMGAGALAVIFSLRKRR